MIDIFAKKVSSNKRQILYLFYILLQYLRIKDGSKPAGRILYVVSGRAPHSSLEGKKVIEALYRVMKLVNDDVACGPWIKMVFMPNFSVALCEMFVSAADTSQHISTPGTEVSDTLMTRLAFRDIKHEVHYERRIDSGQQRWGQSRD
jgi:starch phosphorylase